VILFVRTFPAALHLLYKIVTTSKFEIDLQIFLMSEKLFISFHALASTKDATGNSNSRFFSCHRNSHEELLTCMSVGLSLFDLATAILRASDETEVLFGRVVTLASAELTDADVSAAFRLLALRLHPDKLSLGGCPAGPEDRNNSALCREAFERCLRARRALGTAAARADFDRRRGRRCDPAAALGGHTSKTKADDDGRTTRPAGRPPPLASFDALEESRRRRVDSARKNSWIRWLRWSGRWQKSEDYTTSFIESDHETDKEREANKKKNCCQVSSPTALDDEFSSTISGYKGTGVRTKQTFRADANCQIKDDSRFLHAHLHGKC
jgi:curved DNA-binding protein CbpA